MEARLNYLAFSERQASVTYRYFIAPGRIQADEARVLKILAHAAPKRPTLSYLADSESQLLISGVTYVRVECIAMMSVSQSVFYFPITAVRVGKLEPAGGRV